MKCQYLGDSYDAVKRMWQELIFDWAPLYAEPQFLPHDIRQDFTKLTRIPMLLSHPPGNFSILNDPDTGIRLPGKTNQKEGRRHITIESIINQLRKGALCVITFDQSDYRKSGLKRDQQRQIKMRRLAEAGFYSFYYVSHAPFLFTVPNEDAFHLIKNILKKAGIPEKRIEDCLERERDQIFILEKSVESTSFFRRED